MMSDNSSSTNSSWERKTLEKVLLEHITEQRRARRWSIFFKLILVGVVAAALFSNYNKDLQPSVSNLQAHTGLIDIDGEISAGSDASADNIRDSLRAAFKNKSVKGIVLRINSPGGSPVQARQIYAEIKALRAKYPKIPVYAAIEDLGASAAYLIASGADAIYSDKTSIVGSIGAKIDSFGFVDAMQKLGVERRLYVAGKNKGILDPFSPRDSEEEAFIKQQLDDVHQAFIQNVREGRGARLKETPEIFSGLFWSGDQALKLGLIDGFGDAESIAKELIKAENIVDYTYSNTLVDRLAKRIGASMAAVFSQEAGLVQKGVR